MPFPGGGDDGFDLAVGGAPIEGFAGAGGIGDKRRRVARAARFVHHRHLAPRDAFDRVYQLAHRNAGAGAEIEHQRILGGEQMFERQDMRGGEIVDMDVVADGGAVCCRISSLIGTISGAPYTAQELEKTICATDAACIACNRTRLPATLLR